ncbi:Com family DNA-binding transcriptional regulator [Acinetobacter seifertii]|uniref:Com family DNA-binding transcriptional regulator n=2 Tax=Acinetobacter calcoaceticus/baumannii complex TaxID=909768 RepID=UPI0009D655B9
MMQNINCRHCFKLLARIGHFDSLEIKCPRCKTLNIYMSTPSALPESLEHQKTGKNHEYSIQPKRS